MGIICKVCMRLLWEGDRGSEWAGEEKKLCERV